MTILKPFDRKEFFLKRPSGLIALPSEEAHRRTIEICAELGMEPPSSVRNLNPNKKEKK